MPFNLQPIQLIIQMKYILFSYQIIFKSFNNFFLRPTYHPPQAASNSSTQLIHEFSLIRSRQHTPITQASGTSALILLQRLVV